MCDFVVIKFFAPLNNLFNNLDFMRNFGDFMVFFAHL